MPIKDTYKVRSGDRITRIATNYSVTVQGIVDANPQIFTPARIAETNRLIGDQVFPPGEMLIFAGEMLNIPTGFVDDLAEEQTIRVDAADELTILIDGKKCPLPHIFEFIEYFDTCSDSFNIVYPYDPSIKNPAYRVNINDFKTKGLPDIKIYIGEDPVLTGSIEIPSNRVTSSSVTQTIAGRSKTFLLEKSDVLPSIQREFIDLTLLEIARLVTRAYSIDTEISDNVDQGEIFPKVNIEDNEKPYNFIARLSRERSAIATKTPAGKCLITKAIKSDPVANFKIEVAGKNIGARTGGKLFQFIGVQSLEFTFDTSELFGTYIGKGQTTDDQNLTETVASQVLLQQSVKILSFQDADSFNLSSLTAWEEQKAVREFYKNAIPFPDWINPNNGRRWTVGETITLEALEAGIEEPIEMLVRFIKFTKDVNDKRIAVLNLIPTGVYL